MNEPTTLSLATILTQWRPGSGAWDWPTEWASIIQNDEGERLPGLITDINVNGITEPIWLGDDGRVWDGHHRLMIARLLGIEHIAVEHGHTMLDPATVDTAIAT